MENKVSVVVPAYNVENYIKDTLDCLVSQTLKGIEVIVVNDGSTDSTQDIIDGYCQEHDFFISVKKENGGVSSARNVGLTYVTGKYVLFLDGDDVLTENSLEAFYNRLEKTGADVAIGRLQSFGAAARSVYNTYADALAQKEHIDTFDKSMLWNFLVGNKCYRTQTLREYGTLFPKLRYSEEGVFFFEFIYKGAEIVGAYDACMKYRRHEPSVDASVTQSISLELVKDFSASLSQIFNSARDALERKNASEAFAAEYLDEILYKADITLMTQFLRLVWQSDEATLAYIESEHERLYALLSEYSRERVNTECRDISFVFSQEELALRPKVSVLLYIGGHVAETVTSLYLQSMPEFELIIPKGLEKDVPVKWRICRNLRIIDGKNFLRRAKRGAVGKYILVIKKPLKIDPRILRFLVKLRIPESLKKPLFTLLFNLISAVIKA